MEGQQAKNGMENMAYVDESQQIENMNNTFADAGSPKVDKDKLVRSSCCSAPTKTGILMFIKKYFWEGQKLRGAVKKVDSGLPWYKQLYTSRKFWAILMPFVFWEVCWWSIAIRHNFFQYFPDKYEMSITMIFGATVAGMTTEGGGAVAFPVMTLALQVTPAVARDFSLMIQACGMTAAAFTIFWMKVKVEKHSLLFCSTGAIFGMVFGLEVLDSLLDAPTKKLGFVSIWFSFAFALFLVNREHKRVTFDTIPDFTFWKACVLLVTGFLGGIFSALTGSGVDICSFSMICLLFRISEKVATPTSVVLMAINTCVGFYWRELMMDGVEADAWEYLAVCVPIVVFFAPMGSLIASHFHRQVLASMIYILDTIALITALCVIPMLPDGKPYRIILVCGLIAGGFVLFGLIGLAGRRYEKYLRDKEDKQGQKVENSQLNETKEFEDIEQL